MNRKQLIEHFRKNMPQGLNELETVRYIYLELGKIKAFDIKYYYGNRDTQRKIYALARRTERNTDEVAEKKTIICVSLSYLFRDILKDMGIKCNVVIDEEDAEKHMHPVVHLSDGRLLDADVQMDLHKIQTGSKTKHFTMSEFEIADHNNLITDEEIKQIDKKLGYIKNDYKDKELEELSQEVKKLDSNQALEHIINSTKLEKETDIQGYVEAQKYYYSVFNKMVPQYWEKKMYQIDCYRLAKDNSREYTLCMFSKEKEEIKTYMYSLKEKRFLPVDMDNLVKLEDEGLVIGRHPNQIGAKILKKAVKQHRKEISKEEGER